MWGKPHDFIQLTFRNYDKYLAQVAELYTAGNSLREISRIVDLSKTKVRDLVLRAGIPLRSMRNEKGELVLGTRGKRNVKPPHGFWFLNGEVQKHPKEYPIVLEIVERWKSGQAMNSIATWLNKRGVKSPMNKKLSWNSVNNVINRSGSKC
ncbi:MAG: recombinase family protein [Bdellovibrionaceae bacterium]|nr:recombinase family protein [Pseudobdellovibrionaceae bacterium]